MLQSFSTDTKAINQNTRRINFHLINFILALVLIIGIFFRFVGLDTKPYTTDEVRTLLRSSGYTSYELQAEVFNGTVAQVKDIEKYQKFNPEKTNGDVIQSLAEEDVHPPLYFILLRFWMKWFGQSPFTTRALAVCLGVLTLPLFYWLCLELFGSPLIGWTATALAAISPFQLINSQETRPYSLWSIGILLSCIFLLKALKSKGYLNWVAYSIAFALALYAHINFVFVAAGQAFFVAAMERFRITRKLLAFSVASSMACLWFLPWVLVVISSWNKIKGLTGWLTSFKISFLERIWHIIFNLSSLFLDLNYQFSPKNPIPYLFLFLIGYSIYYLCRNTPRQTWLIVICLIALPAMSQIIPDFITGGRRTIFSRYLTPSYLGVMVAVSYLLAMKITEVKATLQNRRLWQICLATIVTLGILSCGTIAQASTGRTQGITPVMHLKIAKTINQIEQPLLISDHAYSRILSLSSLLRPETNLQIIYYETEHQLKNKLDASNSLEQFKNIFIYLPSKTLLEELETRRNYKIEAILKEPGNDRLWLAKLQKLETLPG